MSNSGTDSANTSIAPRVENQSEKDTAKSRRAALAAAFSDPMIVPGPTGIKGPVSKGLPAILSSES